MPADSSTIQVVVADANILINLIHVDQLNLLGRLPGYEFVVPGRLSPR